MQIPESKHPIWKIIRLAVVGMMVIAGIAEKISNVFAKYSRVEVWENERHYHFVGWRKPGFLDRAHWTFTSIVECDDSTGAPSRDRLEPPEGYQWDSEWTFSEWSYAVNFVHSWHDNPRWDRYVRRRKWTR